MGRRSRWRFRSTTTGRRRSGSSTSIQSDANTCFRLRNAQVATMFPTPLASSAVDASRGRPTVPPSDPAPLSAREASTVPAVAHAPLSEPTQARHPLMMSSEGTRNPSPQTGIVSRTFGLHGSASVRNCLGLGRVWNRRVNGARRSERHVFRLPTSPSPCHRDRMVRDDGSTRLS